MSQNSGGSPPEDEPIFDGGGEMRDAKARVAVAIHEARESLERALIDLARLPAFDPCATAFLAHALNNYLTVSQASIDLLGIRLGGHPDPEVRQLLTGLDRATELMAHAVSRLQGETTQIHFESHRVDVLYIIERAIRHYKKLADEKQISLLIESTGDDFECFSDGVTVAAILDNLLSNAIKYSPPGGTIRVQATADADGVMCEVRDQGEGLSPADQERLFERGAKLTPKPTGGESTHGYGLAVAKVLVTELGGTIGCKSELGKGSCFWFQIPHARPKSGKKETASA